MANIDKLIINDPSASEPTNPLEMYVAKINGTYTGDIPEPTNDLEKALAQVAAGGSGGSAAEWPKLKITCSSVPEAAADIIEFAYPTNSGAMQMTTMADVISMGEMIIPTTYMNSEEGLGLMGFIGFTFEDGYTIDTSKFYVSIRSDPNSDAHFVYDRSGSILIQYWTSVSSLSDIPTMLIEYNDGSGDGGGDPTK